MGIASIFFCDLKFFFDERDLGSQFRDGFFQVPVCDHKLLVGVGQELHVLVEISQKDRHVHESQRDGNEENKDYCQDYVGVFYVHRGYYISVLLIGKRFFCRKHIAAPYILCYHKSIYKTGACVRQAGLR